MQVSKNNIKLREQRMAQLRPHYGIRKLSMGVASVLLSLTFLWGATTEVHADTTTQSSTDSVTETGTSTHLQDQNKVALQQSQPASNGSTSETPQQSNVNKSSATSVTTPSQEPSTSAQVTNDKTSEVKQQSKSTSSSTASQISGTPGDNNHQNLNKDSTDELVKATIQSAAQDTTKKDELVHQGNSQPATSINGSLTSLIGLGNQQATETKATVKSATLDLARLNDSFKQLFIRRYRSFPLTLKDVTVPQTNDSSITLAKLQFTSSGISNHLTWFLSTVYDQSGNYVGWMSLKNENDGLTVDVVLNIDAQYQKNSS